MSQNQGGLTEIQGINLDDKAQGITLPRLFAPEKVTETNNSDRTPSYNTYETKLSLGDLLRDSSFYTTGQKTGAEEIHRTWIA